jgi:hypothetical protein
MEDNIYILRTFGRNVNFIKVGFSDSMKKRLKAYYGHNPLVEVIMTTYKENGLACEKALHSKFRSVVMNEWYNEELLREIIMFIENFESDEKPVFNYNTDYDFCLKMSVNANKNIAKTLTNEELGVFFRMVSNTEIGTNKISLIDSKTTQYYLIDFTKSSKWKVNYIFEKLISNGLIDEIDGKYYINNGLFKPI